MTVRWVHGFCWSRQGLYFCWWSPNLCGLNPNHPIILVEVRILNGDFPQFLLDHFPFWFVKSKEPSPNSSKLPSGTSRATVSPSRATAATEPWAGRKRWWSVLDHNVIAKQCWIHPNFIWSNIGSNCFTNIMILINLYIVLYDTPLFTVSGYNEHMDFIWFYMV